MPYRLLLIVAAVGAIAWLVPELEASVLFADGQAELSARPASRAHLERARARYRAAARHTADTTSAIREAGMDYVLGQPAAALQILRAVLRREPDNYEAWSGVRFAAGQIDPPLAARAVARMHDLNPRQSARP